MSIKSMKSIMSIVMIAASFTASAHEYEAGAIHIGHPYARATAPGQPTGGGYLKLDNRGTTPDRLLSANSTVSKAVELHVMKMDGDVMRMRQVDAIDIPAGQTVELKPGGLHLMFVGLNAPFKIGDRFPVTLKFEKAGDVKVDVVVQAVNDAAASGAAGHRH